MFYSVVGYRNWKYVQDGKLYNENGAEVGTDGKPIHVEHGIPKEVLDDVINPVTEPPGDENHAMEWSALTDPNEMTTEELKSELRSRGVSIVGKFKYETLVAKVKEARNVEG